MSDEVAFYRTRAGRQFYESTMPELVRAIERLADTVAAGKRSPAVQALVDIATELDEATERVLEIVPGDPRTVHEVGLLREKVVALKRILARVGPRDHG